MTLRQLGFLGTALGATFGLMVGSASAQSVPAGSYLESCREVRDVAGWLKASCRDRAGRWVDATMAIAWCAPGNDIVNDNGRLVCGGAARLAPPPPPTTPSMIERPPYGSYMASCRDVRMVAGWLKATCQDARGRWVDATTAASWCTGGRDIANIDGRLTCR
ncbi:CVNH domain-containing protein [Ancylobacter rudongensis]|uniref:CVNH domain-containing protein n=1 Tax=Ancylobacter rudongensis TaxID=177413 RepID=A0A1G4T9Z0_9HYPH|nr:CVNH domain-containing protein [Ancylobacter rudongensis]SCW78252.1 CVNH domain-containing protein [Ancylobacter rudongensis]